MADQAAAKKEQPLFRIAIINNGTLNLHSSAFIDHDLKISELDSPASQRTTYSYESPGKTTAHEHVVVDTARGLMWSRRPISAARMTFAEAEAACKACMLDGHTDWRLPTREELVSIVDYGRYNPAIDQELFPDTPPNYFWSSSPDASDPDVAWVVIFSHGFVHLDYRHYNAFVRAVRSVPASQ